MNQQFRQRQFPAGNPLANALVVIVGIIVISLSVALGVFVFLAVAGFVLVMAIVMSVRNWWLRKTLARRAGSGRGKTARTAQTHQVIEGEYYRVERSEERRDRP